VRNDPEVAAVGDASPQPTAAGRPWAVYLLHCVGNKSYIGISPEPEARFEIHRAGKGAAFTRANRPHAVAAVVWFENRSAAASMEVRLKGLARSVKLEWFAEFGPTTSASPATREDGLASLPRVRQ
jgi:predicted GIY-YIG superfamily endonuclease